MYAEYFRKSFCGALRPRSIRIVQGVDPTFFNEAGIHSGARQPEVRRGSFPRVRQRHGRMVMPETSPFVRILNSSPSCNILTRHAP